MLAAPLAGVATLDMVAVDHAQAQQQTVLPVQQDAAASDADYNNGKDFTRPETLFQLRYRYQTSPGTSAANGTTRTVTADVVTLRSDFVYQLDPSWKVAFRGDLPLTATNPFSPDNPSGDYVYGLGDADFQAALVDTIDSRWAAGAGLRIIAPTGADNITSGKWQMMPIIGARTMLPEIGAGSYFSGTVWYDMSFAGDPTRKHISNLRLDPTFNVALPDHWFFTLYPSPDIRINYGDPIIGQTGRLFLPFDFSVGHSFSNGLTLSLEVGVPIVNDYPVYDFKTITYFNMKF